MNALGSSSTWAAATALCLVPAPALAQNAAKVKAEIAFARGLASEWSFVDLAEEVIEEVETEGVTGKMGEQLALVRCEVYAIGARNEREHGKREALFERALTSYLQFIERNPYSELRGSAEAALVDTSALYARALEAALEEAVGEDVDRLKLRQSEVLQAAVEKTGDLIAELEAIAKDERTEAQTRELHALMLNRGNMLADIAQTQEDGTYYYGSAIEAFEQLAFDAGEDSPAGLRAFMGLGKVYAYQKDWAEAAGFYQYVVQSAWPTDPKEWADLKKNGVSESEKQMRFKFLQLATSGLLEALTNLGDAANAALFGLHFYNAERAEGIPLSGYGYLAMLDVARAVLEAGGFVGGSLATGHAEWYETEEAMKGQGHSKRNQIDSLNFALKVAQRVNDENRGRTLQIRAQKLIAEIITRPGTTPAPDVLFEAAQGEYYDKNYKLALDGFRRVLRAIEGQDQASRIEYGAKVMNNIGNTFRRMDRRLESAMAFREGCTAWRGDIEYDELNAQGYYKMITRVADDAVLERETFDTMVTEAEQIVLDVGTKSADQIEFNNGLKAIRKPDQDWARGIEHFARVPKGSVLWELAQVKIGTCEWRLGNIDGALEIFNEYLEGFLKSTDAAGVTSPTALGKRREASATAEFYRGMIHFNRAVPDGDEAEYQRVIDYLDGFETRYPEQPLLAPWAMQMVVKSQLGLGDRPAARATFTRMVELYPNERRTGATSLRFYNVLKTARGDSDDPALLREMAELLELSNSTASSPSYGNLRNESSHWMELEEWARAQGVLERIIVSFGESADERDGVRKYVIPDLGQALVKQKKLVEARAVLGPLIQDDTIRPGKTVILNWARSVTGWIEGPRDQITIVPGAGDDEAEFELVAKKVAAIAQGGQKWTSCEWYEQKFMVVYTYYVWSNINSRKRESARSQLAGIEDQAPQFDYVQVWCESEETPQALRDALGGQVLRQRFLWLKNKLAQE